MSWLKRFRLRLRYGRFFDPEKCPIPVCEYGNCTEFADRYLEAIAGGKKYFCSRHYNKTMRQLTKLKGY